MDRSFKEDLKRKVTAAGWLTSPAMLLYLMEMEPCDRISAVRRERQSSGIRHG